PPPPVTYSPWYLKRAHDVKYPWWAKHRGKLGSEGGGGYGAPVGGWVSIIEDADKAKSFKEGRGRGGFVRSSWQEVNELIAASNVYTIKNYGPDRVAGFSP
ncbi:molybdopterin-dependent oxidoreductase, partial [Escherichia coli]|uniref:molybdopterin-dependent oxidoreductase n=1 Tax=Escherichia coli TaxID=562 RepID=UPI0014853E31